ncbi:myb-like DNA-binding domain-containing protein [Purpureocillium lilacinum]|uniref:Myb-like DNA-binding domain-containing protein n=1 Tax=Purpureocillium lilacinum TaxID=33203 RepID=A0A179F8D5_PURLI|nr:myb-like DNA-binding domain-containing protein [Purpureocillium lilacinum]
MAKYWIDAAPWKAQEDLLLLQVRFVLRYSWESTAICFTGRSSADCRRRFNMLRRDNWKSVRRLASKLDPVKAMSPTSEESWFPSQKAIQLCRSSTTIWTVTPPSDTESNDFALYQELDKAGNSKAPSLYCFWRPGEGRGRNGGSIVASG